MIYSKKLNIVIVNYCLCENEWFKHPPWVLARVPPPPIQGNDLVLVYSCLAHGAGLVVGPHLQPLVQAGPAGGKGISSKMKESNSLFGNTKNTKVQVHSTNN